MTHLLENNEKCRVLGYTLQQDREYYTATFSVAFWSKNWPTELFNYLSGFFLEKNIMNSWIGCITEEEFGRQHTTLIQLTDINTRERVYLGYHEDVLPRARSNWTYWMMSRAIGQCDIKAISPVTITYIFKPNAKKLINKTLIKKKRSLNLNN